MDREFYWVQRRCSLPFHWLQRQGQTLRLWLVSAFHRSVLASAFSLSVPTATTAMHPTPVRLTAIMGRATSITVSFWAWAHGPTGAMATDGATTASLATVEDVISAVMVEGATQALVALADTQARAPLQTIAVTHSEGRLYKPAAAMEAPAMSHRQAAHAKQHLVGAAAQHPVAAEQHTAAAEQHLVAAADNIANRIDIAHTIILGTNNGGANQLRRYFALQCKQIILDKHLVRTNRVYFVVDSISPPQ